ncbi:primosomal protein N' [Salsuginibacillus kocurii]|uniref:primosomal protein N' n=1 Tax=Salsuginibacillus kocurii TaxID=427078 RepID=UPI000380C4B9|nr:primosomal protein N' [Salsuginibacillus kocurii]
MIARVIVDVAAGQTDKLFDYDIPAKLEEMVDPGMRVVVPFGPRKLQGFVMAVESVSDVSGRKEIVELLDPEPVLTQELIELGKWLVEETVCFHITAYQAMLPAAMRGKTSKQVVRNAEAEQLPGSLPEKFHNRTSVAWKDLDSPDLTFVKKALAENLVFIEYKVKDQARAKLVKYIQLSEQATDEKWVGEQIKRAKKQQQIVDFLKKTPEPQIALSTVLQELSITKSVVDALVQKEVVVEKEIEMYRDPFIEAENEQSAALPLTDDQQQLLSQLTTAVSANSQSPFLLRGVTGSGKTEVYLQTIDHVLKEGKEAIVLVPEISLTPQMVERFKARFGQEVAVLHSALSIGEKYDEWRKIHRQEVKVVVGARSAIFAPFQHLGLIIIDEEHESTYKQEDHPRYHARDVAIWRSSYHQCPVLLGSATPSLESYARANKGVYTLLELPKRVNNRPMPAIEVVDMREELREGNRSVLSQALYEKLKERIARNEQSVLFLNRRGFSTFVMCRNCGFTAECPHCDITLTYHRNQNLLKCHYCAHEEEAASTCPECESEHIRFFGTGTQRVEEELQRLLPEARIIRMDVDTTQKKGAHEKLLSSFGAGEADILLGTQMIAKGLDFPNITLAGVLAADTLLKLPDFRAAERTFQLLTQVSGRAGRDKVEGEVVIQSYEPEHYSIQHAKSHDFVSFYYDEMKRRHRALYPPYVFICLITISHPNIAKVIQTAGAIGEALSHHLSNEAMIYGPTPSPIARIKDRYRYQCMIKYRDEPELSRILKDLLNHYKKEITNEDLYIAIDRHPQMFM